jgi:hypothetical protein
LTILKSEWKNQRALKQRRFDLHITLYFTFQPALGEQIAKGLHKSLSG